MTGGAPDFPDEESPDEQPDVAPPWHGSNQSSSPMGGMPRGRGAKELVSAARAEANYGGGGGRGGNGNGARLMPIGSQSAGGLGDPFDIRPPLHAVPSSNIMGGVGAGGYPGFASASSTQQAMRRPQRLAPINSALMKLPALPSIGGGAGGMPPQPGLPGLSPMR